jgi:hypothetical protein
MPKIGKGPRRKVFVFGSNREGRHGAGTALEARQKWGAICGQAEGMQGCAWGIVTKELRRGHPPVTLREIELGVDRFYGFGPDESPHIDFHVAAIGCGLAGFTPDEIAWMFDRGRPNVYLPECFTEVLRRRPVLVGESNPYGADPDFALFPHPEGSAGWRLAREILGMESTRTYLRAFRRVNLCPVMWSMPKARETIAQQRLLERPCILLGRKVADAFGVDFRHCLVHLNGSAAEPRRLLVLGHPSGRNLLYNAPGAIAAARAAVVEFLPEMRGLIGCGS